MLFHSTRGGIRIRILHHSHARSCRWWWLLCPIIGQVDLEKIKGLQSLLRLQRRSCHFYFIFVPQEETIKIVENTWHDFEHQDLVGIQTIENISVLELFHGPTAAFKDFGLQLAAAFFNEVLEKEDKTAIVLGATSGDTGSAAIDACRSYARIKSFIMLPNGNMSEVQRRQMSTIEADNVFALRINGTFDDCQIWSNRHSFKEIS